MTIKDYVTSYELDVYYASAGDTLKTVASVLYQNYSGRVFDLLVALNGNAVQWDNLSPLTAINYININNLNLITEKL